MHSVLILGSGQLGLMMATYAGQLGLHVDRLDVNSGKLLPGSSRVRVSTTLEELLTQYDVITAEVEHLPTTDFFQQLYQSTAWMNRQAFDVLPDRCQQKQLLDQLTIPTAPWQSINSHQDMENAAMTLGEKLVIKVTRGGYDGRGQWVLPNQQHPPRELYGQLIAEKCIAFSQEVSLIGARSRDGHYCFLPMSKNVHQQGILRFTLAGTVFDQKIQEQAERLLTTIMESLDYVGVMAMECFITGEGELLINELAPRVHNSGHWSQLGAESDQFSLHLHALLDLPLLKKQCYRPVIMLNLIGCEFNPQWLTVTGIQCHWYGKSVQKGRKLGHINIDASSKDQLQNSASSLMPLLDDNHRDMLDKALGCR